MYSKEETDISMDHDLMESTEDQLEIRIKNNLELIKDNLIEMVSHSDEAITNNNVSYTTVNML